MKRIMVTGIGGFVGSHLSRELKRCGYSVVGVGKEKSHGKVLAAEYFECDLSSVDAVGKLDFSDIDAVIHLAGLAAVGPSFDQPMEYISTNMGIEVNLFEAALRQNAKPKFLIISSGALYDPKATLPINETSKVLPSSPYAISKLGQEQIAGYYQTRGFECIVARPFNHFGPGQNPGFVAPDLARQIVNAERGETRQILVGNLEAKRDYTDVRDIVRAYVLLLEKGRPGETYNICSGQAISGKELLKKMLAISVSKPEVVPDKTKMRPTDTPLIYGSYDKLAKDTGWKPEITLDITLKDVLEDWRGRT